MQIAGRQQVVVTQSVDFFFFFFLKREKKFFYGMRTVAGDAMVCMLVEYVRKVDRS